MGATSFRNVDCWFYPTGRDRKTEEVEISTPEDPAVGPGFDAEQLLRDYRKLVERLVAPNAQNVIWWCSEVAARNRFYSPLPRLLSLMLILADRLEEELGEGRVVHLTGVPYPVFLSLNDLAKSRGWKTDRESRFAAVLDVVTGRGRLVCNCLRYAKGVLSRVRIARRLFPEVRKKGVAGASYLIKTFAYMRSFRDGSFFDPFFGGLAAFLESEPGGQEKTLTVCVTLTDHEAIFRKMAELPDRNVVPLECFLTLWDVFRELAVAVFRLCVVPPKAGQNLRFGGRSVTRLVGHVMRTGQFGFSFYQYLHKAAVGTVARQNRLCACAMTYEGHPWERMLVAGLKEVDGDIHVVGCQHSVVPMAAAGVFPGPAEVAAAPLPDTVLAAGNIPASIIRRYSDFPESRVRAACSLRYDYLYNYAPSERTGKEPFTILVALDGIPEAVVLVDYALRHAVSCPDVCFRLRAHPIAPLEGYLARLGKNLDAYDNVVASDNPPVPEELRRCDAVLYWGSTVALEALMIGRPVINYDRLDAFSYDPLFDFETNKWTVRYETPLSDVVRSISSLSTEERERRKEEGRRYVRSYFSEITDEMLALFKRRSGSSPE